MMIRLLTCWLLALALLNAQQPEAASSTPPAEAAPTPDSGAIQVSVLGFHDFTPDGEETEMRISTAKFRDQMQRIRDMGISVISLEQFTAWKRGDQSIPERSVLLTLDDGWKSVYEEAYPVLKEFNYPFTIYLYKNYVDGGGRALTTPMIKEMLKQGATIGSHSVSHPYPVEFKKQRDKSDDAYDVFLRREMGESKRFLESKFRAPVETYSYPGGYVTEEMLPIADEFGYHFAFTTKPGKAKKDTPDMSIPRFMILGNYDRIFEFATNFGNRSQQATAASANGEPMPATTKPLPHPVFPEPGAIINLRMPIISANLAKVDNIDPESVEMRIAGFAKVPATFDPETKMLSWQVNRQLRQRVCQVFVTWKDTDGNPPENPLRWSFQIDREAAYLLEGE